MHEDRSIKMPIIASVISAAALIAALFAAGFYSTAQDETNVVLGAVALLYGTSAFLAHGKGRITALGLFNFAFALFVGYGGISEGLQPVHRTSAGYVTLAIAAALAVQITVNLAAWRRAAPASEAEATMPPLAVARQATWLGAAGIVLVFVAQETVLPPGTSPTVDGAVFTSVVLFVFGLIFRADTRLLSLRTVAGLAAFALYAEVFHQGDGRLRLVALACVLGLLITARFPRPGIKWATVLLTPAAIWWLAQDRLSLQESLRAGGSAGHTGLESMTTPILVFAQIIKGMAGPAPLLVPSWGRTFLSVPFIVVPQGLRPAWAPPALGYQLVELVDPSKVGTGFSVAGTVYGEAYWDFGWLGLVLAVPILAWLLMAIDARFRGALADLAERPLAAVSMIFWLMLAGGIADLAWNGTHVWIARHVARMPVLLLLALVVWYYARKRKVRDPRPVPPVLRERLSELR